MSADTLTDMVRRIVCDTGTTRDLALALKRRFGWKCTDSMAVSRVCQMLSSGHPERKLPADALEDVIRVTGSDDFLDRLYRVKRDVDRERRELLGDDDGAGEPVREIRKVRRERRRAAG